MGAMLGMKVHVWVSRPVWVLCWEWRYMSEWADLYGCYVGNEGCVYCWNRQSIHTGFVNNVLHFLLVCAIFYISFAVTPSVCKNVNTLVWPQALMVSLGNAGFVPTKYVYKYAKGGHSLYSASVEIESIDILCMLVFVSWEKWETILWTSVVS